jgi:hypothetical protein
MVMAAAPEATAVANTTAVVAHRGSAATAPRGRRPEQRLLTTSKLTNDHEKFWDTG